MKANHPRNITFLLVVLNFTLSSWHFSKPNIANQTTLDCSLCDASANGGVVNVPIDTEGFTEDINVFCNNAAVSLQVSNAILPNDTYQGTFMVTDEDLNIVAYAEGGTNNTALIGFLPAGEYLAWHLVYTNTVFPALPAVGASAAALIVAGEEGEGCLVLSEPVNFSITEIIQIEFLGLDCFSDAVGFLLYSPIVQVSGGCPEEIGFGAYSLLGETMFAEEEDNLGGFLSGIYVGNTGITGSIFMDSLLFSGIEESFFLSVTADGCGCGSNTIEIITDSSDCL